MEVKAWLDHNTYDTMEIVVRFHHRLVQIHPIPNGNGRLGRVAAEMLSVALGGPTLSWGSHLDLSTAELRERYIGALHAADDGDVSRLAEVRFGMIPRDSPDSDRRIYAPQGERSRKMYDIT